MPGKEENRNFYLRHTYFEVHRRKVSFPLLFFTKKLQFFFVILPRFGDFKNIHIHIKIKNK